MTESIINPNNISEWMLDMYADGEAPAQVAAFLDKNPAFKAQWLKQRQSDASLAALYRFDCPPPERLRAYYWNELSGEQRQKLESHAAQCPLCAAELASLQQFMQESTLEAPTKAAPPVAAARSGANPALLQRLFEQAQTLAEQMHLVVAQLIAPASPQLATVAFRGETPTTLLFETPDATISLLAQSEPDDSLTLAGQIFTPEPMVNAHCKLISADAEGVLQQVSVDSTGNFVVDQLPAGAYQLIITHPGQSIIIPNLVI